MPLLRQLSLVTWAGVSMDDTTFTQLLLMTWAQCQYGRHHFRTTVVTWAQCQYARGRLGSLQLL